MRLLCDWEWDGEVRRKERPRAGAGGARSRAGARRGLAHVVPVKTGGAGPRAREDAAARPRGRFRLAALSRNVDIHRKSTDMKIDRQAIRR